MTEFETVEMLNEYRQAYREQIRRTARAFGVETDKVRFHAEEGVCVAVNFPVRVDTFYPEPEDVYESRKVAFGTFRKLWDFDLSDVRIVVHSPDEATVRGCGIEEPDTL